MKYVRKDINKFAIFSEVPIVLYDQNCPVLDAFVFIEGFEKLR